MNFAFGRMAPAVAVCDAPGVSWRLPSPARVLAAGLAAAVVAGCGGPSHPTRTLAVPTTAMDSTTPTTEPATAPPAPPSTTITTPPATTAAPPRQPRPYAVGTTSLSLTDDSRSTGSTPGRRLPTLVFYPIAGGAGPAEHGGAPALAGPWPLVVFAEGYNVTALTYHDLLHHLAEAGFVVAAPAFPLETGGGPLDENDLQNEPADISFVISQVLSSAPVRGASIDHDRIGVVGHSDGAEAALGAAFLPGSSDNRIGPVVSMAGQAILNGDHVVSAPVTHPLLVVQGSEDTINPPDRSDHLYATAPEPKAYLHLLGGGHLPPVASDTPWRPIVERVVVDWLDQEFGGFNAAGAGSRLGTDGTVPGLADLTRG